MYVNYACLILSSYQLINVAAQTFNVFEMLILINKQTVPSDVSGLADTQTLQNSHN